MKKFIGSLIIWLGGWKESYPENFNTSKCVMISAPHTSLKDYIFTAASFWKNGIEAVILSKNKDKITLSNCFLKKSMGYNLCEIKDEGINYSINLFNDEKKLILIFHTESSVAKVDSWKTEFYEVAVEAEVPIALGYLDYSDRTMGVGHLFKTSGDKNEDLKKMENFYKNFTPKHPEKYNKKIR